MLRKALTLVMVFIFALSLLAVSMITCFTYDAEAHPPGHWSCTNVLNQQHKDSENDEDWPWCCYWYTHG